MGPNEPSKHSFSFLNVDHCLSIDPKLIQSLCDINRQYFMSLNKTEVVLKQFLIQVSVIEHPFQSSMTPKL